jgi:hypothetical protein
VEVRTHLKKRGKTCEADCRAGKITFVCLKEADVKLQGKMKKTIMILVAVIGLGFSAWAQIGKCEVKGILGAYIVADGWVDGNSDARITVTAYGVSEGAVDCVIKYVHPRGDNTTEPQLIYFKNNKGEGKIHLSTPANIKVTKITDIQISNPVCKQP